MHEYWIEPYKRYEDRLMATYAAMVENMDSNIGRLVNHLAAIGESENTMIVFLSDNGAAVTDFRPDLNLDIPMFVPYQLSEEAYDNSYENVGNWDSYVGPRLGWGQVSATPFRGYKGSVAEGGTRSPTIVSFPGRVAQGTVGGALGSLVDLAPTFLEIAGVEMPGNLYQMREVFPITGVSMVEYLQGSAGSIRSADQSANIGNAFYLGDWKLVSINPPIGNNEWRLFNIEIDPLETNDLSQQEPERFRQMQAEFDSLKGERCALIGCQ